MWPTLVDVSDDAAQRLHAVNCILNRDGVLSGTNTDGRGFVEALARGVGFDPAGQRCLIVGAGGAARAVIQALAAAGAAEVAVLNRTQARAVDAATLADQPAWWSRMTSPRRRSGPTWSSMRHRSA